MTLALFDLDNTLIAGDSDHLWGSWLADQGIVDPVLYRESNDRFYTDYQNGTLDIEAFLRFSLAPLADNDYSQLCQWREIYLRECIEPVMLTQAEVLIRQHREEGHELLIITATNQFITRPIADRLGIEHLIATEAEWRDGQFTGRVQGTPSFRQGKVERLAQWLQVHHHDLSKASFYSDSHNDLPLLEQVGFPVAVDPDETLNAVARERHWPIISLRDA